MEKKNLFNKLISFTASVHRVTHELTKDVKPSSITPVQYNILEYIAVSQPVTPSEISECQYISMPNTSRELRKLSEQQLIEKSHDTADRRKQYIYLSNDGTNMMHEAFASIESRFLDRIQHATKEDIEEIERALDVLHARLFYK